MVLAAIARYTSGFPHVARVHHRRRRARGRGLDRVVRDRAGRPPLRGVGDRAVAGDARQPARVLRRHLRAQRGPAGRRADRDPRLDPGQRAARARTRDRRGRLAGARPRDALRAAAAERHRDAADDHELHRAAGRIGGLGPRLGQPPHQDDLDRQRGRDPGRLLLLGAPVPQEQQGAGRQEARSARHAAAPSRSACWSRPGSAPRSCRTGSCTRSSRRSTRSESRRRSPAW